MALGFFLYEFRGSWLLQLRPSSSWKQRLFLSPKGLHCLARGRLMTSRGATPASGYQQKKEKHTDDEVARVTLCQGHSAFLPPCSRKSFTSWTHRRQAKRREICEDRAYVPSAPIRQLAHLRLPDLFSVLWGLAYRLRQGSS